MHFGIDASRLAVGKRTGTENYAFHVTKGLLQQAKSRHRFTLYFNQLPAPNLLYDLGLPPSATPRMMPFPRLWTHLRLSQEMVRAAPDLLFVPAHVLPLIHPARSVVTLHDLGYLYFPQAHTPAARRYLDFSTRFSASQAQKIIAVSQATKADLVRHYNIPPEKIRVVYHGYDQKRFRPLANLERLAAVQERYHLKPSPYLLYVGTLQPRKNLSRLIEAFASLIGDPALDYPHREQLQLILGGQPGWWSNPLVEMVKNLKLENRIIFTGYLADEDLPVLLSHATAFVLPSLYEGFGMGVIEAMACGTPVICSNTGSLPEVAGNAALLHHPLDRLALEWNLRRLLTNAGLREDLAQKGLLQASRFSWEQSAAETLEVLESLG